MFAPKRWSSAPFCLSQARARCISGTVCRTSSPEALAVVHFAQMGDLMCRHIVQYKSRRENQPPGKAQGAARRAGAPAGGLVAYADALWDTAERAAMMFYTLHQIGFGLGPEPVGKPARPVSLVSRNANTREVPRIVGRRLERESVFIAGGGAGSKGLGFCNTGCGLQPYHALMAPRPEELNPMLLASQRNNGAGDKRHWFRKPVDLPFEPVDMPGQKAARLIRRYMIRKRENGDALGIADFQRKPRCSAGPAKLQWALDA